MQLKRRVKVASAGWGLVLIGLVGVPSCDRSRPSSARGAQSAAGGLTLRQTYDRLRELRTGRAYYAMRPHLDRACRDEWMDLLIATDELLVANAGALDAVSRACPTMSTHRFDVSWMADRLDLLSREVDLVSVEEQGDRGVVTVQISKRVPLRQLTFERRGDFWVWLPGPVGEELVAVVREMAEALNRLGVSVSTGSKSEQEVRSAYQLRMGPPLARLRKLVTESQPAGTASEASPPNGAT